MCTWLLKHELIRKWDKTGQNCILFVFLKFSTYKVVNTDWTLYRVFVR